MRACVRLSPSLNIGGVEPWRRGATADWHVWAGWRPPHKADDGNDDYMSEFARAAN